MEALSTLMTGGIRQAADLDTQIGQNRKAIFTDREVRYVGTLLGLAIGDAFGMPLEFLTREEIQRRYGEPVTRFEEPFAKHPNYGLRAGQYTDDTQLALLLAETLLERRGFDKDRYKDRLVAENKNLRGLGSATRNAIKNIKKGREITAFDSLGCGTLTRAVPLGLWYNLSQQEYAGLVTDAFSSAEITHSHHEAIKGAALVAVQIAYLKTKAPEKFDATEFLDWSENSLETISHMHDSLGSPQLERVLQNVRGCLVGRRSTAEHLLTPGGTGPEVMAIALYAFLSNTSYLNTITDTARFGGDVDSYAALAGAYAGALRGIRDIPKHLFEAVENRYQLEQTAARLYTVRCLPYSQ